MSSTSHRTLLTVCAIAAAIAAAPALAQWAWRDANGRMVYSGSPPPVSVADKDIVQRPQAPAGPRYGADAAADKPVDESASKPVETPAKRAATRPKSLADREIEFQRRRQQQAEAQAKAAEDAARKTQNADNCERLRNYQRALDDGLRIARYNARGEREVLDDAARAAESARTRQQIEQNCR